MKNIQINISHDNLDIIEDSIFTFYQGITIITSNQEKDKKLLFNFLINYLYENKINFTSISQENFLIDDLSVKDNINLFNDVDEMLLQININIFDISNLLEKNCNDLTLEEQELVALVNVFSTKTNLILIEDSFNNLSTQNFENLKEVLSNSDKTIVLFSNAEQLNELANNVYEIKDKKLTQVNTNKVNFVSQNYEPKKINNKVLRPKIFFITLLTILIIFFGYQISRNFAFTKSSLTSEIENGFYNGIPVSVYGSEYTTQDPNTNNYYIVGKETDQLYFTKEQLNQLTTQPTYDYVTMQKINGNYIDTASNSNPRSDFDFAVDLDNYSSDSFYYQIASNVGYAQQFQENEIAFTFGNEISDDIVLYGATTLNDGEVAISLPLALTYTQDVEALIGKTIPLTINSFNGSTIINVKVVSIIDDYKHIVFNNPEFLLAQTNADYQQWIDDIYKLNYYVWNYDEYVAFSKQIKDVGVPIMVYDPSYQLQTYTRDFIGQMFKFLLFIVIIFLAVVIYIVFKKDDPNSKNKTLNNIIYNSCFSIEDYKLILKNNLKKEYLYLLILHITLLLVIFALSFVFYQTISPFVTVAIVIVASSFVLVSIFNFVLYKVNIIKKLKLYSK